MRRYRSNRGKDSPIQRHPNRDKHQIKDGIRFQPLLLINDPGHWNPETKIRQFLALYHNHDRNLKRVPITTNFSYLRTAPTAASAPIHSAATQLSVFGYSLDVAPKGFG